MFDKSKVILYLALISYLDIFYKCSWLPGNKLLLTKSFYINETLTIILVLLFFDFSLINSKIHLFYEENKYFTLLTLILIISSVVYNFGEFKSLYYISYYFGYIFNFLIYFIFLPRFLVKNKNYLYWVLLFISSFSLLFCIIGLLFTFAGLAPEERFVGFVTSVLIHPNYVPSVCLAGLFSTLALFHLTHKELFAKRIYFILSFLTQFIALFFSFTRDGMIAFSTGILFFYFILYRKKFLYFIPVILASVPFLLFAFIKLKGFASFLTRFLLLIPAYYMLISDKTKLIWGYGASNSRDVYVGYKILYNIMENVDSPHNSYISFIMMYGLLFTAVLLWIIFKILKKGFKTAKKENNKIILIYYSLFISAIIAYLVVNLFESHLAMVHLTMMQPFLLFLGLLFYSLKNKKSFNPAFSKYSDE